MKGLDLGLVALMSALFPLVHGAALLDPVFVFRYPILGLMGHIGRGVVLGGMVTDPGLIEVGDNTVIGGFSTIMCHATEHGRVRFGRVRIGRDCGVGARSTVVAGAGLEDGALLGAGSLLPKNTVIPAGQTWGGVPARSLPAAREASRPESEIQNNPQ